MKRPFLAIVFALAALSGCSRPTPMPQDVFPDDLAGWHRTSVQDLSPAQSPDGIPANVVQQVRAATYEGAGKIDVRVYGVSSSGVALDLVQRWQPRADTVFFYVDRFFVVLHWQSAEKKALQPFLAALEKRLAPKK